MSTYDKEYINELINSRITLTKKEREIVEDYIELNLSRGKAGTPKSLYVLGCMQRKEEAVMYFLEKYNSKFLSSISSMHASGTGVRWTLGYADIYLPELPGIYAVLRAHKKGSYHKTVLYVGQPKSTQLAS